MAPIICRESAGNSMGLSDVVMGWFRRVYSPPHPATRRAEEAEELEEVRGKMKELQALAVSLRKVPINDGTMFFFEFALAALKT